MLGQIALHERLDAAAIEVRQPPGQKLIQPHLQGEHKGPFVPIPFRFPAIFVPPQFQLWNPAVHVQEVSMLFQGIHRPGIGFMAVTDSHTEEYGFLSVQQVQLHIRVPQRTDFVPDDAY